MRRGARCQGSTRRPYIFSEIQVLLPSKGKGHDWTNDDGIGRYRQGSVSWECRKKTSLASSNGCITLPSTQRETSTRRKSVLATARKSFAGWSEIELRRRERIKPTLLLVQNGHGAMSDLIRLCGQKRTLPTRTYMLKRKAGGEPGCQKTALSS
jgi:hypothetical protein